MIAVITPVFNGSDTLVKSIQSLQAQSFSNWISIIINDGSTDGTAALLEQYESDERFYIIQSPNNMGRGYSRSLALSKAKELGAKYMCMLDADDVYHVDKLSIQYAFMESHPDIVLLSSSIGVVNSSGLYRVYQAAADYTLYSYSNYVDIVTVPHASSIVRMKDIDVDFDSSLRFAEDQDFMRRLLIHKKYAFSPQILYYYNRDASFSADKYKKSLDATMDSFKRVHVSKKYIAKLQVQNLVKYGIFVLLKLFKAEKIYYNRIGRVPVSKEVDAYRMNEKNISGKVDQKSIYGTPS